VQNTFKISQNSFSSCISCHFAGAFVRLTGSGMGCQIGQNALAITSTEKELLLLLKEI
jgi:hypothetical protein